MPRLPPKRKEPGNGQSEDFVSEAIKVEYEMRRCPTEIDVSAFFKRNERLQLAIRDEILGSCRAALVILLHSAFSNNRHWANVFLTVERVKFLRKMAWARGAYQ